MLSMLLASAGDLATKASTVVQTSLIWPGDVWSLYAVILVGTAAAIWLEQNTRIGVILSGPVVAMLLAMFLSNARILPMHSEHYGFMNGYLLPLAVPMLMFRANIVTIIRETKTMFVAMNLACLGTVLGAFLAHSLMHSQVDAVSTTHPDTSAKLSGVLTASYIGGGVNFFATKDTLQPDPKIIGPLQVADNLVMAASFVLLAWLHSNARVRKHFRLREADPDLGGGKNLSQEFWKPKSISLFDIGKAVAVSSAIVAMAMLLKAIIDENIEHRMLRELIGNRFVIITTLTVIAATMFEKTLRNIRGPEEIGGYLLFIFLFSIGIETDILTVIVNTPILFLFCFVIAMVNIVVPLAIGKIMRIPLEELLIASNASLGGPTTAAAMSISKGWTKMVLPSFLVGIWGYTIGTVLGVWVGRTLETPPDKPAEKVSISRPAEVTSADYTFAALPAGGRVESHE